MDWLPSISLIEGEHHKDYLRQAYAYAWQFSDDDITKVGAIIVSPYLENKIDLDKIISYGANKYPCFLNPPEEQKNDKSWKHKNIIHAEVSAINNILENDCINDDLIMYMPWVPCKPCAEEIIFRGLKTIIGHKELIEKTPDRWHQSTSEAIQFLKNNCINIFMYSGKISGVESMFNGEYWKP